MSEKYTIGVDFGTLSGRAVLVAVSDGREIASSVMDYKHGVISDTLPATGEKLPPNWALEDPADYLAVLEFIIPDVIRASGVDKSDIIGICADFTCCTLLPIAKDGTPLCFTEKYRGERNAYVKLWKHHAAQPYADRMNEICAARGYDFLVPFGNKMSSEWMFPKIWETLEEAPDVYADAAYFIEAGDWINLVLTGRQTRGYLFAAFKSEYIPGRGYPPAEFFAACDERMRDVVSEKLDAPVIPNGSFAGSVSAEAAARFGLPEGIAVAASLPDAHVAAPALGISSPGDLFGIFGTSNCYFAVTEEFRDITGICGCVEDSLVPGYYGTEAGLCCVGDHFAWVADNLTPASYKAEADRLGLSPLKYLVRLAAQKKPGETGLLALDWWNGNRNVLVNGELTGLLIGMTLQTRAEDILRALIEATAFGTRVIFDTYRAGGVRIDRFVAAGGIARKDPFTMQLYADVLHMPIHVAASAQVPALGSAIFAAAAAGRARGGYDGITEAAAAMQSRIERVYTPDEAAGAVYDRLFAEYVKLHDFFGRGGNDVLMRLRNIR